MHVLRWQQCAVYVYQRPPANKSSQFIITFRHLFIFSLSTICCCCGCCFAAPIKSHCWVTLIIAKGYRLRSLDLFLSVHNKIQLFLFFNVFQQANFTQTKFLSFSLYVLVASNNSIVTSTHTYAAGELDVTAETQARELNESIERHLGKNGALK